MTRIQYSFISIWSTPIFSQSLVHFAQNVTQSKLGPAHRFVGDKTGAEPHAFEQNIGYAPPNPYEGKKNFAPSHTGYQK
jgi:hypothetical protein